MSILRSRCTRTPLSPGSGEEEEREGDAPEAVPRVVPEGLREDHHRADRVSVEQSAVAVRMRMGVCPC